MILLFLWAEGVFTSLLCIGNLGYRLSVFLHVCLWKRKYTLPLHWSWQGVFSPLCPFCTCSRIRYKTTQCLYRFICCDHSLFLHCPLVSSGWRTQNVVLFIKCSKYVLCSVWYWTCRKLTAEYIIHHFNISLFCFFPLCRGSAPCCGVYDSNTDTFLSLSLVFAFFVQFCCICYTSRKLWVEFPLYNSPLI